MLQWAWRGLVTWWQYSLCKNDHFDVLWCRTWGSQAGTCPCGGPNPNLCSEQVLLWHSPVCRQRALLDTRFSLYDSCRSSQICASEFNFELSAAKKLFIFSRILGRLDSGAKLRKNPALPFTALCDVGEVMDLRFIICKMEIMIELALWVYF